LKSLCSQIVLSSKNYELPILSISFPFGMIGIEKQKTPDFTRDRVFLCSID
jgi:hypothetical protein